MSRIDVVAADKGKYKVLVNFIQHGVELSDPNMANNAAIAVKKNHYKFATLNLVKLAVPETTETK
jgi:hypothetical protein